MFLREKEHDYLRLLYEIESFIDDLYRLRLQSSPLSELRSIEPSAGGHLTVSSCPAEICHVLVMRTVSHLADVHLQNLTASDHLHLR